MKRISNILLFAVFAAALLQAYRAHMELKINCEAFEWQMKNKTEQFDAIITGHSQRVHTDRRNLAPMQDQRVEQSKSGAEPVGP